MNPVIRWAIPALLLLPGCEDPLQGDLWAIELEVLEDDCSTPASGYSDTLEFRMETDGQGGALLALGPDPFAAGQLAGCFIDYQSVAWTETSGLFTLTWQLVGEAQFRFGGSSCNLDAGVDWQGTETFTILASDDPDIPVGCTTVLSTTGTYVGEL